MVVVPAIDGNYETSTVEMASLDKQFRTLHSVQSYFLLNELLAPGLPILLVDTEGLRRERADSARRFCKRRCCLTRAANQQVLLDETCAVL